MGPPSSKPTGRATDTGPRPATDLAVLYEEMLPVVYGYCRARLPQHDAEDVCADVFRSAAERLVASPATVLDRAWFLTVARNRIIDRWRSAERWRGRLPVLAADARPIDPPERGHDDVAAARELLDHLPSAQRAAVVLHYLDGSPVKDVAETLGRSPSAVESLLARARRTLLASTGPEVRPKVRPKAMVPSATAPGGARTRGAVGG